MWVANSLKFAITYNSYLTKRPPKEGRIVGYSESELKSVRMSLVKLGSGSERQAKEF
jgi:hypothetical protein